MTHTSQDSTTVRRLRQGVGIVGMAMPFAVTIGNAVVAGKAVLLSSLSGAYYTGMRDVFVGSLCAIGVFLICYRYARPDDILSSIAGYAAIIVALFPTTLHDDQLLVSSADNPKGIVHGVAAIVLFLVLAIFCFFFFPQSVHPQAMSARKKARNVTYYICGTLILAGLAIAALAGQFLPDDLDAKIRPMLWGESIAVLAFGVAWFAKSNTFLPDMES